MKIGDVDINDDGLILGPMAGVTDLPFRLLCRQMGAVMAYTEMVSAKAVLYKNRNTAELLRTCEKDAPLGLQLFGSEPEVVAEAAALLEDGPWSVIDINMGCPVPKVVGNGEGSALMKDPMLAGRIVEALVKAVKKPVTVKIRKGFDDEHVNAPELAHILQESGASAVTVHARTRQQYYHGKADWPIIAAVKERVSIPVIGNGDVTCFEDAERMRRETGCDAVMAARAACGDPWIFRKDSRRTNEELRLMIRRHLFMQIEYQGKPRGILEMRKHLAWYTRGLKGGASYRESINKTQSLTEVLKLTDELFESV